MKKKENTETDDDTLVCGWYAMLLFLFGYFFFLVFLISAIATRAIQEHASIAA